jgi:hypothetical protein
MNWTAILATAGIPDSPGHQQAITPRSPEPLPADLSPGQPCCVWFVGGHTEPSSWRTGFRIEALAPDGVVVGDRYREKGGAWISTTLPRCRIHPGAAPPEDDSVETVAVPERNRYNPGDFQPL